ncbi:hypothetical protein [Acidithiobacillus ferriphilus]|uniref:hypothetical protein n=1 Tax=Acidithiobacillus ferriphilus TaxID=1689834 RepID=UPI001C079380|nr:hypothetical protein [Acidithiobacillus ferriphilus]MBU2852933.1 hypothetical protein [Acidithiobacillus ferriphilus]
MIESDIQREIDNLNVVIMELRQDLDGAMRLRQVWKERLAELVSPYSEVDAAHWEDISLREVSPCEVHPLPGGLI